MSLITEVNLTNSTSNSIRTSNPPQLQFQEPLQLSMPKPIYEIETPSDEPIRIPRRNPIDEPMDLSRRINPIQPNTFDSGSGPSVKRARLHDEMIIEIRDNVRNMKTWFDRFDPKTVDKLKSEMKDKINQLEEERNSWAQYATKKEEEVEKLGTELSAGKVQLEMAKNMSFGFAEKEGELTQERKSHEDKENEWKKVKEEMALKIARMEEELHQVRTNYQNKEKSEKNKEEEWKKANEEMALNIAGTEEELHEERKNHQNMEKAWQEQKAKSENEVLEVALELAEKDGELTEERRNNQNKEKEWKKEKEEMALKMTRIEEELRQEGMTTDTQSNCYRNVEVEFDSFKTNVARMVPQLHNRIKELEQSIEITAKESEKRSAEPSDIWHEEKSEEQSGILHEEKLEGQSEQIQSTKPEEFPASSKVFVSDDPIVRKRREDLLKLEFAWVKFGRAKKSLYFPAFIHPKDKDGVNRAQKISANGYVSNAKSEFFDSQKNIPEENKGTEQLRFLSKFNHNFSCSFK
ncbi:hypothetical protein Bhyg_02998, partial [Pseudolycoriella hygida]